MVFTNQSLQKGFRFLLNDKVDVNFTFILRLLRRYAPRNDKTSNARIGGRRKFEKIFDGVVYEVKDCFVTTLLAMIEMKDRFPSPDKNGYPATRSGKV